MSLSKSVTCLCFVALCFVPFNAAFVAAVHAGEGGSLAVEDGWKGSRKMMMMQQGHERMLKQACEGDNCNEASASAPTVIDDDLIEAPSMPAPAPTTDPKPSIDIELPAKSAEPSSPGVDLPDEAEPSVPPSVSLKDGFPEKPSEPSSPAVSPSDSLVDEADASVPPSASFKDELPVESLDPTTPETPASGPAVVAVACL